MRYKILVAAVVFILAALCLSFPSGCGRKVDLTGGPDTVVVKFYEAAMAKEADTAFKLLDRESQAEVENKEQFVAGFSESIGSYSVGHPEVSGEKAKVPVTLKLKPLEHELRFDMVLVLEDGAWRISMPESEAEMMKARERLFKEIEPPH
ncbi:MAG: hypothetical protein H5T72_10020 [Actinobacteria bacterium]|nr:hypothetical protein [Actinomycetota bacterium]